MQGFIENLRNSKYMAFIVLKDITGKLQITVEKEDHPDLVDTIDKLTPDSVITVTGKVMENDYVKMGGVEMIPESIEIESIADALPIVRKEIAATKKKKAVERSSIDQRIDYRWIDLRTDENQLMFKAQSCFVNAMRKFLLDRNFIEIHTPKLIAAASESGSEVFKVDYFDRNAYLAQSPQFYKQMAMAAGFERIFETGPVFRAEKSYTNKHATEFSGFDLEFSYITSFKDVMKMEEELLLVNTACEKAYYDLRVPMEILEFSDPISKTYADVLRILNNAANLLDMRVLGSAEFTASCQAVSDYLKAELYGKYCKDQPETVICIGHTHIDVAWQWTLEQTREKVQRSFSTVLQLMKKYPEYKFMSSQSGKTSLSLYRTYNERNQQSEEVNTAHLAYFQSAYRKSPQQQNAKERCPKGEKGEKSEKRHAGNHRAHKQVHGDS